MQEVRTGLGLNFLYLLFLLIPGYVALKAYLRAKVALDDMTRLDKIIGLALGGFTSLIVLILGYRLSLGQGGYRLLTTGSGSLIQWRSNGVSISSVATLSVLQMSVFILSQSVVAALLGYWYGKTTRVLDSVEQSRHDLRQPWEMAFYGIQRGDELTVVTSQDREIKGAVLQAGSPSMNYDLLLSDPEEIYRDERGKIVHQRDLGQYSYHHYQDVSRIDINKDLLPEETPPTGTVLRSILVSPLSGLKSKLVPHLSALGQRFDIDLITRMQDHEDYEIVEVDDIEVKIHGGEGITIKRETTLADFEDRETFDDNGESEEDPSDQ